MVLQTKEDRVDTEVEQEEASKQRGEGKTGKWSHCNGVRHRGRPLT